MLVRVEGHPCGPRLYLAGYRSHHYHWGGALIAVGTSRAIVGEWAQALALVAWGTTWIWQDRADIPTPGRQRRALPVFDPVIGRTTSHDRGWW